MAVCPACGKNSINAFAKLVSDEMYSVRCKSCSAYAYVPSWLWQWTGRSVPELLTYACIVAAFLFYAVHSAIPLVGVVAMAAAYVFWRLRFAKMIVVPEGEARARLRWGLAFMGVGFVVVLVAFCVQALR